MAVCVCVSVGESWRSINGGAISIGPRDEKSVLWIEQLSIICVLIIVQQKGNSNLIIMFCLLYINWNGVTAYADVHIICMNYNLQYILCVIILIEYTYH